MEEVQRDLAGPAFITLHRDKAKDPELRALLKAISNRQAPERQILEFTGRVKEAQYLLEMHNKLSRISSSHQKR